MNDKIKEKLAYLRQWFYIFILSIIGIIGWIFTNDEITQKTYLAYFSVSIFSIFAIVIHLKIIRTINKIKNGNNNS